MAVTSKVIKIGFADAKDAEKKLNEVLKTVENFIGYNIVNNGHHSSVIIFMDADAASDNKIIPQVKIIPYSITNPEEAEKTINEVLKDIDPIRLDVATPIDGNRLIILYDGTSEEDGNTTGGDDEQSQSGGGTTPTTPTTPTTGGDDEPGSTTTPEDDEPSGSGGR